MNTRSPVRTAGHWLAAVIGGVALISAAAQAQPVSDMQDAWQEYLATVDQVEQLWQAAPEYQNDPVGAYDLLSGFMTTNFTSHINSSGSSGVQDRCRKPLGYLSAQGNRHLGS